LAQFDNISPMILDRLSVAAEVQALRPDFTVCALAVRGAGNGPGDEQSHGWLREAEAWAAAAGDSHPHIAAWHEAYRAFGAKPQRTAPSVDALWKRARGGGLPRVNWLVDLYNAVSVRYVLPVGGEDLAGYAGPIRLVRATGDEPFDTVANGAPLIEYPAPGEVVWVDDRGVTCRRWNWRQGTRTRLTEASTDVLFLLERLAPLPLDTLAAAAEAIVEAVRARYPAATVERRVLGPATADAS
jgi:DNA/RNA-binding domain of Phe-tRNA-synthetase-like protein